MLDLLADRTRQRIVWALAHQPCTPTPLAHALRCSQPLVSKHLRILRAAGLVESHPHSRDHIYDIRREPFTHTEDWLNTIHATSGAATHPPPKPYI